MALWSGVSYNGLNSYIFTPIDLVRQWMGISLKNTPSRFFHVADKCKTVLDGLTFLTWIQTVGSSDMERKIYIMSERGPTRKKVKQVDTLGKIDQGELSEEDKIVCNEYRTREKLLIWAVWLNEASNFVSWLKEESLIQIESQNGNNFLFLYRAATSTMVALFQMYLMPQEIKLTHHCSAGRDWGRWFLDDIVPITSRLALVYLSFYSSPRAKTWELYWNTAWCAASYASFILSLTVREE